MGLPAIATAWARANSDLKQFDIGKTRVAHLSWQAVLQTLAQLGHHVQTDDLRHGQSTPSLPVWPGEETSILAGQFALRLAVY